MKSNQVALMNIEKADKNALYALLNNLGIAYELYHHRPIFTVEEGQDIKTSIKGGHSKNLFLKDKNGVFFLICALGDTQIKLNQVHKAINCARLSFGNEDLLYELLGVTPGSVSLFALINDTMKNINLIIDKRIMDCEIINFHPLLNDATIGINISDMKKFIFNWGGNVKIADFSNEIPIISEFS